MRFRNPGVLAPSMAHVPRHYPLPQTPNDARWFRRVGAIKFCNGHQVARNNHSEAVGITESPIRVAAVANTNSTPEPQPATSKALWEAYRRKVDRAMEITLAGAAVWLAVEWLQKLNLRLGVITNQGVDVSLSFFLTLVPPAYTAVYIKSRNPNPRPLEVSDRLLTVFNYLRFSSLVVLGTGFLTEIIQRNPDPLDVVAFTMGAEMALMVQEFFLIRPLAEYSRSLACHQPQPTTH